MTGRPMFWLTLLTHLLSHSLSSAGTSVEYLAGALAVTPEEFAETLQKAQQELQRLSQERKQQLLSVVMEL